MIRLNVHEAKTHLSRYLDAIAAGEVVLLCRRNVPIAEIRAIPVPVSAPRIPGAGRALFGEMVIEDAFFEPLPPEMLLAFEGG